MSGPSPPDQVRGGSNPLPEGEGTESEAPSPRSGPTSSSLSLPVLSVSKHRNEPRGEYCLRSPPPSSPSVTPGDRSHQPQHRLWTRDGGAKDFSPLRTATFPFSHVWERGRLARTRAAGPPQSGAGETVASMPWKTPPTAASPPAALQKRIAFRPAGESGRRRRAAGPLGSGLPLLPSQHLVGDLQGAQNALDERAHLVGRGVHLFPHDVPKREERRVIGECSRVRRSRGPTTDVMPRRSRGVRGAGGRADHRL